MSRAFVKEPDGGEVFEDVPEKLISEHPNLVTPEGLALIETYSKNAHSAHAAAQLANDRGTLARAARDLRYWSQRLSTAEVQPAPLNVKTVQFGSTVTLRRDDGRQQKFRIVGEDEANPAQGSISYVAPLAQALLGKSVGDVARAGQGEAEILTIG